MSLPRWTSLLVSALLCSGCDRPPVHIGKNTRKPLAEVVPVPTRPFEDGYAVGFEVGKQEARPRAKLPEPAVIRRLATKHSIGRAVQRDRWERGFIEGYHDGFRNVVTGRK